MQYSQHTVSFLVQPDRLWTMSCKNSLSCSDPAWLCCQKHVQMNIWGHICLKSYSVTWHLAQPNEWYWLTSEYCHIHNCDHLHLEVLKCISKLNRLFSSKGQREGSNCSCKTKWWLFGAGNLANFKSGPQGGKLASNQYLTESMRWCKVVVQISDLGTWDRFQTVWWK